MVIIVLSFLIYTFVLAPEDTTADLFKEKETVDPLSKSLTGVGYDSALGMLMYFDAPLGVTLRLGWSETNATSSVGMGFTWWSGGDGLKTSIGTAYDMVAANDGTTNDANLSVVVGFGF